MTWYCPACQENTSIQGRMGGCAWCDGPLVTLEDAVLPRITNDQVRLLHELYMRGSSLPEIGEQVWEQFGFKNANSAQASIYDRFKRLGLETRSPSQTRKARQAIAS